MNVRKNVKNMTADEKTRFVNALLALKAQPSVLNPGQQGRYDDYVEIHVNAMMAASGNPQDPDFVPGWGHDAPAFLPWHRELLLQLENDLQAAVNDPGVTIPYWDWPDPASWPFTDDFLGGDGAGPNMQVQTGPFAFTAPAHWTLQVKDPDIPNEPDFLQRAFGASNLPTIDQVNTTLSTSPYDSPPWKYDSTGFRQEVQYGPHNMVHRYVGGTMLGMDSPNDPVFWLNHCNVDRLWSEWQSQHPADAAYLPTTGATTGHNLDDNMIFNANPPPPWSGSSTPKSVIDHHALGYSYDSESTATAETFAISMPEEMLSRARANFPLLHEIKARSRAALPESEEPTPGENELVYELAGQGIKITYRQVTRPTNVTTESLSYQVPDDNIALTFTGNNIRSQKSELGTLHSVTLQIILATVEETKLTLLLPDIDLAGQVDPAGIAKEPIETVAILTKSLDMTMGPPPARQRQSYHIYQLRGTASLIFFP